MKVSSLSDLNTNAGGTTARIIEVSGTIAGNVTVGSNKTLVGACGAEIHGHIQMTGSVNVIVRNLTVVGYNCTDNPSDCSGGADAISVERQAHHLLFDHDDISDGSDGNLDITHASDFITISWTKFHYSGRRTDPAGAAGGHQFSNLIGHSDSNASEDTGHLTVTFHHDWWADNVVERMPRVRFGQVHLFDNLYTAAGDDYCIGVGVSANIRDENDVFVGVKNPIDSADYSNGASIIQSTGDLLQMTTGTSQDIGGAAFTPPYAYTLDPASGVEVGRREWSRPRSRVGRTPGGSPGSGSIGAGDAYGLLRGRRGPRRRARADAGRAGSRSGRAHRIPRSGELRPAEEGFVQRLRSRLGLSQAPARPGRTVDVQIALAEGRTSGS